MLRCAGLVAGAAGGRVMHRLGTWLMWLPRAIGSLLARLFWSLLGLTDLQQRSLMTWSTIGAIVATSFAIVWGVDRLLDLVPVATEPATLAIIDIVGDVLKLAVILLAIFSSGMVLIARGGEMTIKGPGGLEVSARGAGARELAKSTDLEALTKPEDPAKP